MQPSAIVNSARMPAGVMSYVRPIAAGLSIVLVGLGPWTVLARLNATVRPDLPWAALATVAYLTALLAWLGGMGPPASSAERRRDLLRILPVHGTAEPNAGGLPTATIVGLLAGLYVAWIAVGRISPIPDLTAYPTSSYRWSMFIMGALTAGVVEEAAYRGYMQRGLEQVDPSRALWITSGIFTASHITQGLGTVLVLGPGLFAASMLYGLLALRTRTIVPGMMIHALGDLAYTYFGVLHGNGSLLFVQ